MEKQLSGQELQAVKKLARSTWGQQGVGSCRKQSVWIKLVHEGFARPVFGQPRHILSLTIKGFRALHAALLTQDRQANPEG